MLAQMPEAAPRAATEARAGADRRQAGQSRGRWEPSPAGEPVEAGRCGLAGRSHQSVRLNASSSDSAALAVARWYGARLGAPARIEAPSGVITSYIVRPLLTTEPSVIKVSS